MNDPRIIVALDYPDAESARALVACLSPQRCRLKVGKELFTAAGPALVEQLVQRGFDVFLDLKYHDIPNTVAQACRAACALGVWMLNVHALGGRAMMSAAREALESAPRPPKLIAVTVLTSHSQSDLAEIGIDASPQSAALRLARVAQACGLAGVVCSAQEARSMREALGARFLLVTPGIRPSGAAADDQSRIATPRGAIDSGASYLVVGRPITRAGDPSAALAAIQLEVDDAESSAAGSGKA